MSTRSKVILAIRLLGLASVLFGAYALIATYQQASSPAMASLRELTKNSPVETMFSEDALRPDYTTPGLWISAGLVLLLVSAPLTRLLFSGLEPAAARSETQVPR